MANQREYENIDDFFSSIGISPGYYAGNYPKSIFSDSLTELDESQKNSTEREITLSEKFKKDLKQDIKFKEDEKKQIENQLILLDLKIDQYDILIGNIDKKIISLSNEINSSINEVKVAYDARVAAGCSNSLHWNLVRQSKYTTFGDVNDTITLSEYVVEDSPNLRIDYSKYGAKYYRKPQNQDYGFYTPLDFDGSIGIAKSSLTIVGAGGTIGILVGDEIIDNIDNPVIFSKANIPSVVGFGTTLSVVSTIDFYGSISVGSTILSGVGTGTTTGISTDYAINLSGVLPENTTIVGIGTTTILQSDIWDPNAGGSGVGGFITTSVIVDSLILNQSAIVGIATTEPEIFKIGIIQTLPTLNLSENSIGSASSINFLVIRKAQENIFEFDINNNPINPIKVGILDDSTISVGHKLVRVNNGKPVGPFKWEEILGPKYAPEPECGAGFSRYYFGNRSWPIKTIRTYDSEGILLSTSSQYAELGDKIVISVGSTSSVRNGIGYTSTPGGPYPVPSGGLDGSYCQQLATNITTKESERDIIITRNVPQIDNLISSSLALRRIRDKLEGQAFCLLQGKIHSQVELNNLKKDLTALNSTDFREFEPSSYYFNENNGKFGSQNII
jgi:hypothetical protein